MINETFLKKYSTVNNAIITLGDTDDSGKGRHFKSRFIQPGLAGYPGQYGNALIKKENLDKFIHTMRNKPVIINHKDKITEDDKVGEVFNVWFNPDDGWYWCDGVITDVTAQNLIQDKGWSVSCSYDFTSYNDEGGTENNIPYDIEFLDGEFTHLALVNNPRYERANIVFNSKGVTNMNVQNKDDNEKGKWITVKGTHIFIPDGSNQEEVVQKFFDKQKGEGSEKKQSKETNSTRDFKNHLGRIEKLIKKYNLEPHQEDELLDELSSFEAKLDEGLEPREEEELREELFDFEDDIKRHHEMEKDEGKQSDKDRIKIADLKSRENEVLKQFYEAKEGSSEREHLQYELDALKDERFRLEDKQSDGKNGYSLSDKYKNHVQFDDDKDSGGYPRKIHKDLESALESYKSKTDHPMIKKTNYSLKDHPAIVKNPLGDGYIVATWGLAQKHDLTEVYPIDRTKADNSKETDMALIEELKKLITKVENDKGDNMINNEKEDKRKLIDEVGGILKGKVDDEVIRTIIKKMEEASYNESEAGSADNEKDEEDEKEDKKEVENKKVKNEDAEDKVAELKEDEKEDVENKCKNSINNAKGGFFEKMNEIYNSSKPTETPCEYVSREAKIKAAEDYFA